MPRGNPAKLNPPIRSTQEAREKGRAGGKKSGQARRVVVCGASGLKNRDYKMLKVEHGPLIG